MKRTRPGPPGRLAPEFLPRGARPRVPPRPPGPRPGLADLGGVTSDGAVRTLLRRGLIEPIGRRETVGHPVEYATTFLFLEYFGLKGLDELPPLDAFAPAAPEAKEAPAVPDVAIADNPAPVSKDQPLSFVNFFSIEARRSRSPLVWVYPL